MKFTATGYRSKPRLAPIPPDRIDALKRDKGAIEAALAMIGAQWAPKAKKYYCPFHQDNTPSMTLHRAEDGVWRAICHGACHRTGWDVFALVCEDKGWAMGQGQAGLPKAFRFITSSQKELGYESSFSRSIQPLPPPEPEGPTLQEVLGVESFDQLSKGGESASVSRTVKALCDLRQWHQEDPGIALAIERGNLRFGYSQRAWKLGAPDRVSCWFMGSPSSTYCEARRLDSLEWWGGGKARIIGGSHKGMPLGIQEAKRFPQVYMAEGGPDYVRAHTLAAMHEAPGTVGVIGMLGGKFELSDKAVETLRGKAIRILAHSDEAGRSAAMRWAGTLRRAGALVAVIHVGEVAEEARIPAGKGFDLDDLLRHPAGVLAAVGNKTMFFGRLKAEHEALPKWDLEKEEVAA